MSPHVLWMHRRSSMDIRTVTSWFYYSVRRRYYLENVVDLYLLGALKIRSTIIIALVVMMMMTRMMTLDTKFVEPNHVQPNP